MPISHKSYIHQPIGYTSPVDLNLLGKVLQFKQGQFDAGVAKTQGAIDSIAALDVAKGVDKNYLNAKLNNLVTTINNIGGADFSDPNITNQIAGLSSQIYSDSNIINAVANTKRLRYTQDYYKNIKEKKPKDYNPANEWYDMNKFSSWLSDGQVGTSPDNSAGSVTPYRAYQEDWQKMFDSITKSANVKTEITDKGLMYRIDSHKLVSPERIWETASKMLDPTQRQQIGIEGRYTYNPVPVSELLKAYDEKTYNQLSLAQSQLEDYRAKYKGATNITDQDKYEKLMNDKQAEIGKLSAPIQKNADQMRENLYLNDKLRGLQARYAFQQSTTKLQPASDKMFASRMQLDQAKFTYQQQNDALNREVDLAKAGLKAYTDMFGNRGYARNGRLGSTYSGSGKEPDDIYGGIPTLDNAAKDQTNIYTYDRMNDRRVDISESNDKLFQDFVRELGRKKGLSDVIVSDLLDDGNIQAVIDPEIKKAAQEMMNSWQAMTRGEKINYDKLDPLFKTFAGRYQSNQKEVEAIDRYLETIDKQVKQKYGLTPAMEATANEVQRLDTTANQILEEYRSKYGAYIDSPNFGLGKQGTMQQRADAKRLQDQYSNISKVRENIYNTPGYQSKIGGYLLNKQEEVEKLVNSADNIFNLPRLNFSDDKKKNLAKIVAQNAGGMQWYDLEGKPIGKEILDFEGIEIMNGGYSYLKTDKGSARLPTLTFKYTVGSGDDKEIRIAKVPLDTNQQLPLGFGTDIIDATGFNAGILLNGEVKDINTVSGRGYDLKYDLVKYDANDRNDPSVFLRVRKGNNVISLYNRPFPTHQQAIQFMESAARLKTIDEAYNYLSQMAD